MPKRAIPHFPYKNEEEFKDQYVIPILVRRGFAQVLNYHGTNEYGRDLIVSHLNLFGKLQFHGIQVKYLTTIGLSQIDDIIRDTKQAFTVPFEHRSSGEKALISEFTVINGGDFSPQARTMYYETLRPLYTGNITLMSGLEIKNLVVIDLPVLVGIKHEIEGNDKKILRLLTDPRETRTSIELRNSAVSAFTDRPTMPELIDLASIYRDSVLELNHVIPVLDQMSGSAHVIQTTTEDGKRLLAMVDALLDRQGL